MTDERRNAAWERIWNSMLEPEHRDEMIERMGGLLTTDQLEEVAPDDEDEGDAA